jgi:hypothetical protein
MYMKVIQACVSVIANQRDEQDWHDDFYPEVHLFANTLVPIETSSKVAAGPPASGDPQVTLSHVECLPQALALELAGPLVALRVLLY